VHELVQLLVGVTNDLDFDLIEARSAAVLRTGDKTLQPVLEGHLEAFVNAGDWYARDVIADLLYEICDIDALPALLRATARDLGDDQDSLTGMVVDLFHNDRAAARSAALNCAQSPDCELRRTGIWALGFVGEQHDQALIVAAAADADPKTRSTAMDSIRSAADSDPALAEVLEAGTPDPDPQVRVSAISKLGWHRTPALIPLIIGCAADPEPRVRAFVADALGRIPGAAESTLELLPADRDAQVRAAARKALN
jgi:HEAT repeat protein